MSTISNRLHVRPRLSILALAVTTTLFGCNQSNDTSPQDDTSAQTERQIEIIEQRIDANNSKDWQTWESLHTDNAVRTAPELSGPLVGAAAMRKGIEELVVTFPDYNLKLVEAFGSGNRLMARIHTRATMLGPLVIDGVEVPATGAMFEQDWVAVLTFEGEKIAAIDEFHDNYGILIQLGIVQ